MTLFGKWASTSQSTESNTFYRSLKGWNSNINMTQEDFCQTITHIFYKRTLTDTVASVIDFQHNDTEERNVISNFLGYNKNGLSLRSIIDHIALGIARGSKVYLIYKGNIESEDDTNAEIPVRLATTEEQNKMDKTLAKNGSLKKGEFVFDGSTISEARIINQLNIELFNIVLSSNSQLNASASPVIKVKDLTRNVALSDSAAVKEQGKEIASGIENGNAVMIDAESDIILLKPSSEAQTVALENYAKTLSLVSGLPNQYISGLLTSGSYNGGTSDTAAIYRALTTIKMTILDPIFWGLFRKYWKAQKDKYGYLYKFNGMISAISQSTVFTEEEKRKILLDILP